MRSEGPEITVAIPVFNGARYVADTVRSVLAQSFREFELICVDDCSTDGSLDILKALAATDERIRVFSSGENLGSAPKALNFILPQARGKRFAYSSQDDLHSKDWLQSMQNRAEETGADAVLPTVVFLGSAREPIVGLDGDTSIIISNRRAVELSLDWRIAGFALWNMEVVKKVRFHDFSFNADEYTARVLFFNCNKVAFSGGTFLYRQDNPEAITKKLTYRSYEAPLTNFAVFRFVVEHEFTDDICIRELLRTASSMLFMGREFMRTRKDMSAEHIAMAEARLKKAFEILSEPQVRQEIRRKLQRYGVSGRAKSFLVTGSYRRFLLGCRLAAALPRLRF
jgi:glycosyltransferase involved in cell wall biosynthesis